jgi:lysophospholipase L1-like esterase
MTTIPAKYRTTNWSTYNAALKSRLTAALDRQRDASWLSPQSGNSLLNRLDMDVLKRNNVSKVILLEGINDLQLASIPNANQVIQDLTTVINRLHAANIKVILGTLTPTQGTSNVPLAVLSLVLHYGSDAVNTARQQVNTWIRSQSIADGVVDFEQCLRNPQKPTQLLPAYDSGDHLHPNALGHQAMAQCVNLNLLTAL